MHARADGFAKFFDLRGRRPALVDQEIAMELGDLRRADGEAAQARLIDQLPGLVARWILEGRAAGAALDRLGRLRGCR